MKKNSGFTIIELMLTLMVASVLLAIGIPSLKLFVQNGRVTEVTNELVSAIHVARSEAIRRSASACVCSSADAGDPVPSCTGSANWETGWIAFLDINGNCMIEAGVPVNDVLLKAWDGTKYAGQVTVAVNDVTISASNTILFNSRGEPVRNNVIQQGNFSICDDRGVQLDSNNNSITASAVVLSASGHARSSRNAIHVTCP